MTDVQTTAAPETDEAETAHACACSHSHSNRRNVLLGAGAVGATAVLAACGTSTGGNQTGTDYSNQPAPAGSAGAQATGAGPQGTGGPNAGSGAGSTPLAKTADVKVGSGVIKADYVVTQPVAGTFKAFSTVCPHAGCNVNKIDAGVISCPCHGSKFAIDTGEPTAGPATKGLAETKVKVDGDNIIKA